MKIEQMNLRKWYGNSIAIPSRRSYGYLDFLCSSIGIVNSIVQDNLGKSIRVQFASTETAAADQESGHIVINEQYLDGQFFNGKAALDSDTTISSILGLIVHEAAHFAYSPKDLESTLAYIENNTKTRFHWLVARTVGNIIEDVYIEAEIGRSVPTLSWMLDSMNNVFFDNYDIVERTVAVAAIEDAPETLDEMAALCNYLILAKVLPESDGVSEFVAEVFDMIRSATECYSFTKDRLPLVLSVYDRIMARAKFEKMPNPKGKGQEKGKGSEKGEGEGQEGECKEKGEKPSAGEMEAMNEAEKNSQGFGSAHEDLTEEVRKVRSQTMQGAETTRKLEATQNVRIKMEDNIAKGVETQTVYMEETIAVGSSEIQMDRKYLALAEIGRQRATTNRPYGMDEKRGHNIRKLYRISTDSKIFAETVTMNSFKPMQVVILVDCSGSMNCAAFRTPKGEWKTRIELACEAALGAAFGLSEARCDVAVYGHTAQIRLGHEVNIYTMKTFNDPIDNLSHRISNMWLNHERGWNKDGLAIRYVGRKFNSHSKRRVLIVISDGQPSASGYDGKAAIEHTKQMVNELRQEKVDVFSISITPEAKRANDEIYGEQFNVHNEDPNCIAEMISKMFTN